MKTTTSFLAQLDKATINALTTQVIETIAVIDQPKKTFTSAELWNIQKQKRVFVTRRSNAA